MQNYQSQSHLLGLIIPIIFLVKLANLLLSQSKNTKKVLMETFYYMGFGYGICLIVVSIFFTLFGNSSLVDSESIN